MLYGVLVIIVGDIIKLRKWDICCLYSFFFCWVLVVVCFLCLIWRVCFLVVVNLYFDNLGMCCLMLVNENLLVIIERSWCWVF